MPSAPEVDAEECINSIKYDSLSTSEFDSCWQACSQFRLDQINKETSLHNIFEEWPDYKKPGGYRLVSFNFKKLYLNFEPKKNQNFKIDKDFGVVFRNCPGILLKYPEQADNLRKFLLDEEHLRDKNLRNMVTQIDENDIKTGKIYRGLIGIKQQRQYVLKIPCCFISKICFLKHNGCMCLGISNQIPVTK